MKKFITILVGSIFTVSLWSSAAFAEGTTVAASATTGTSISTTNTSGYNTNPAVTTSGSAVTTTSSGITTGTGTDVSITPDNIFYSVKRLIENIQVALTFTPEGKAQLLVTLADKRLAEADLMMERNKQQLVEQVMKAYVKTVSDANDKLEEAAQAGSDVKAALDDIRIIEQTADKLVIRATGVIPASSADALKTRVTDQVKATLAVQALAIAKSDLKDANTALKTADSELETAQKAGDQTAVKAAEAKQQAAQQAKLDAENVKNQVEAYKNDIIKALKDDEKADEDKDEDKDGNKLSAGELQAKIAHLQAIVDKQQQKRAEQVAKHTGQPGKAAVKIAQNAEKQLAKEQARIDALKAQLGKVQTGSTTGGSITAGQTAAITGSITANTSASGIISGDKTKTQAEFKTKDHGNGKAYGKFKVNGKTGKEGRNNNGDENENDD